MLIAGRCRQEEECRVIQEVIENNFKKKLDLHKLYGGESLATASLSNQVRNLHVKLFRCKVIIDYFNMIRYLNFITP